MENHYSKISNFILFITLLSLVSCEDRYFPELDGNYQNVLVIDGKITNAEPPYTVKLSMSSHPESPQHIPVTGYGVEINDELGNVAVLMEEEPGTYQTGADDIQGVVGRKYKIVLNSPQGETYESDFEEMTDPVGIESVNANLEYIQSEDFPYSIPGYQFYINTTTAQNDSTWLLWSMDETYKYQSDYATFFYFDGDLHAFPKSDSIKTCWSSAKVFPFFVESTIGLSEPRLSNYPLHFVSTETRRLSIRYSLLVNQYSINEAAFEYWNGVKEQNASSGELYYTQPYQLRGNVHNINNQDELVLGYFMVAAQTQKRIYVNRPSPPVLMLYSVCYLTQNDFEEFGWMMAGGPPPWPLYVTEGPGGARALPNQQCIDCRQKGGKLEPPDFWEEN